MTRRIFIHAGLPKTSTTAIQSALSANRDRLRSESILYPSISDNHTTPLCTMFLEDPSNLISNKMAGFDTKEKCLPQRRHYKHALEKELEKTPWQTLLLSAEGLSNMIVPDLMKLKSWCETYDSDININLWLREPVNYTTSVIQQLLKGGDTLEVLYKTPPTPNYKGRIQNFIRVFGRENIIFNIYEAGCRHPDGIVGAFLENLPINKTNCTAITTSSTHENTSMSIEAALLISRLNMVRPMFENGKRSSRRTLKDIALIEKISGSKFHLPPNVRKRVFNQTRPDVKWLENQMGVTFEDVQEQVRMKREPLFKEDTLTSISLLISDLLKDAKT